MTGLVSPEWLVGQMGDPSLTILEVSFYRPDRAAWFHGHIPGSHYVYWKDFCWDETERRFPDSEVMSARLGRLGVGDDGTLVLVGDTIQFATYAYWVLAMSGFERLAVVLDGGHQTWKNTGLPMTSEPPGQVTPTSPRARESVAGTRIGRDDVRQNLDSPERTLVDLRSTEEFVGERVAPSTAPFDHGAERGGHIPGAQHLYYERLLQPDGRFRPPAEIVEEFRSVGAESSRETVTYCRLSHRASLGWFALTRLADWTNVRVYDGSWTEWGSMVGMPIER